MEKTSNVIQFPKKNANNPEDIESIKSKMDMMKHYHIQETIATVAPMIFNQLEVAGFHLADDESTDLKDGALIIEALRSMMCKHYSIYHPFQQISENVFAEDKEEIGALRIADSLNLELKRSETV